jgi:hypothetical protein
MKVSNMYQKRVFRPTLASLRPYLIQDLSALVMAISCWLIYSFVKSAWFTMLFSILFSLFAILLLFTSLTVATKRATVTDSSLDMKAVGLRTQIHWEDISKVQIIEKFRGYLPPARADRLILISSGRGDVVTLNSNSWPEDDEEDFLRILREKASEHGFPISTGTTRC